MPEKNQKNKESQVKIGTKGLDVSFSEESWGFKGKNFLFTIGIDKYQHWSPLKCAVKDVQDFAKILIERYQFEDTNVLRLLDADATQKNILYKFRELAKKVTDQDNLLIYFSGHGHYDDVSKTGYWIPVEAETGDENEYQFINTAVVVDRLKGINSLHTFLIIDACFSGTLITQIRSSPRSEKYRSRRVFTSGRAEVVHDGPEGGNSPFARGVINHLAYNTDKYIPASRLILDVMEYVEKEAKQTPTDARLLNSDDQGGDFVFRLKMSEAEIWADVVSQNTAEAYWKFMKQFPKSKHLEEAQEDYDWLVTFQKSTIAGFQQYLNKYQPSGKHVPLAIKTLDNLEEEKCWRLSTKKGTLSAYFEYLHRYPEGKYVTDAKNKTLLMPGDEDDKAIQKAMEEESPESFQEYLQKPGNKKHQEIAEKRLSTLTSTPTEPSEEEIAWEKAENSATFIAFQTFIQAFPKSHFLEQAKKEMKRLDDVGLNQIRLIEYNSHMNWQEKIKHCINYFNNFPGAENNQKVKQIKDRMQIKAFRRNN